MRLRKSLGFSFLGNLHYLSLIRVFQLSLKNQLRFRLAFSKNLLPNFIFYIRNAVKVNNEIIYKVLEEKDLHQTINCLAKVFPNDNPLLRAVGMTPDEYYPIAETVCKLAVKHDCSYITIDKNNGEIIGFLLCKDLMSQENELKNLSEFSQRVRPIRTLIDTICAGYTEEKKVISGDVINLLMLGVKKEYRGQGIASHLVVQTLEKARRKGFKIAISQAVHTRAQQIFLNLDFKEIFSVEYGSYSFQGVKPFEKIIGHTICSLMEKIL